MLRVLSSQGEDSGGTLRQAPCTYTVHIPIASIIRTEIWADLTTAERPTCMCHQTTALFQRKIAMLRPGSNRSLSPATFTNRQRAHAIRFMGSKRPASMGKH